MSARTATRIRRGVVIAWLTLAAFWSHVARGGSLQLNHKEFLQNQGDARYLRVVEINATRGRVVDRNHQPLAISTPVDSVWVNPQQLTEDPERWPVLLELLELEPNYLQRLLTERVEREFVYLKRHVDPEVAKLVADLGLAGVHMQREYRRYYPTGEVAAHVVGFTNVDDVGQEGVELAYTKMGCVAVTAANG